MIEIAISLAVIGFALVAIVGILPIGMNVQKQNREETIINQDSQVLMDAIRNGARGFDDLTNYVIAITNTYAQYDGSGRPVSVGALYWYTPTSSSPAGFPLNSGQRIVGLLSTPTYSFTYSSVNGVSNYLGFVSNHITAYFRALSGAASEKFPQTNSSVRDLSFTYRVVPEVLPDVIQYWTNNFDLNGAIRYFDPGLPPTNYNELAYYARTNTLLALRANLHNVRLNFRWPLLAKNAPGPGQQAFRTTIGGALVETNEPTSPRGQDKATPTGYDLYFFQPRTYVKSP